MKKEKEREENRNERQLAKLFFACFWLKYEQLCSHSAGQSPCSCYSVLCVVLIPLSRSRSFAQSFVFVLSFSLVWFTFTSFLLFLVLSGFIFWSTFKHRFWPRLIWILITLFSLMSFLFFSVLLPFRFWPLHSCASDCVSCALLACIWFGFRRRKIITISKKEELQKRDKTSPQSEILELSVFWKELVLIHSLRSFLLSLLSYLIMASSAAFSDKEKENMLYRFIVSQLRDDGHFQGIWQREEAEEM